MRLCGVPQQEVQTSIHDVEEYPEILITVDRGANTSFSDTAYGSDISWRNVIVPVEETAYKRIVRTFFENGLRDALTEACDPQTAESAPLAFNFGSLIMKVLHYVDEARNRVFNTTKHRGLAAVAQFSETRDWLTSPIRYIAWHPNCFKLAVAAAMDHIQVYVDKYNQILLKNASQKHISCMHWRPFSSGELAVGCSRGVFVWTVDAFNNLVRNSSNFQLLKHPDFEPVTSLQWNKDGNLLAVASISNTDLLIWNYDRLESTVLKRIQLHCFSLKWSPDDSYLLSTTTSNIFRVWHTEKKWTPERWSVPQGYVQSACWSPCSSTLLFVSSEDSLLYYLHFYDDDKFAGEASKMATPIADLAKCNVNGIEVGGQPQSLAWDPNGMYLAIIFKDSPVVAIYTTFLQRFTCSITPTCFISGLGEEFATFICFQTKTRLNSSSVLTIGWSSGRVQFYNFGNVS